ncbi:AcrR family transcriptional regulator [Agrobacterium vitis]|nr:AcrR family transcriptional regulator [Agrobacterium vitis]MBE1440035.1 AcrR family transcriptional regulator [Agrobacterium vitis]
MGRHQTIDRTRILEAADRVIEKVGIGKLTIDAVAKEAEVSKGGVLYAYGTKDALIEAMVERVNIDFDALCTLATSENEGHPQVAALAHVEAYRKSDPKMGGRAAALLSSLVREPHYRAPIKDYYSDLMAKIDTTTAEGRRARVAILAAEGLFWLRGLELMTISENEWQEICTDIRLLFDEK